MKVLVTGGAGFIGSILIRKLLEAGHEVRIMDILNFGFDPIRDIMPNKNLELYPGDIRKPEDVNRGVEDIDAIIHLAAIVGDPACAVQADVAVETNYLSTARLALTAREKGIKKMIFASTCSVYGACDDLLTEESELNPVSLYAETKIFAEKALMDQMTDDFKPIILRLGTLYGLSHRPRFDLVINYLTGRLVQEKNCKIFGGEQWRPFLHVYDVARAFHFALDNYDDMKGERFNVGGNKENYRMEEIGKIFEEIFPEATVDYVNEIKDPRSYKVSFDKIEAKGFELTKEIRPTVRELKDKIASKEIDPKNPNYMNYHP